MTVEAHKTVLCRFAGIDRRTIADGVTTGYAALTDRRIITGSARTIHASLSAAFTDCRTDRRTMADGVNAGYAASTDCRITTDGVSSIFVTLIATL